MFSITTTALSTSIPIPKASPPIEMMFKDIFEINMSKNAAMTEIGIANPTIIVGLISLKNKSNTNTASNPPTNKLEKTEFTDCVINSP